MIVEGIVYETIKPNLNKIKVSIPIFRNNDDVDMPVLNCNICYTPGNFNSYVKGDKVLVSFIENDYNRPIVLGKLYTLEDKESEAVGFSKINALEVLNNVLLPANTSIEGLDVGIAGAIIDIQIKLNELAKKLEEYNQKEK